MDPKERVRVIMSSMSQGIARPLFDAMSEDVTWRWMGVGQWSRTFTGRTLVVDKLFAGEWDTLAPSSSVEVHQRPDLPRVARLQGPRAGGERWT